VLLTVARLGHTYLLQTSVRIAGEHPADAVRSLMMEDIALFNKRRFGQIVSRLSNEFDAMTDLLSTSIRDGGEQHDHADRDCPCDAALTQLGGVALLRPLVSAVMLTGDSILPNKDSA